jgi:outer membrane protein W
MRKKRTWFIMVSLAMVSLMFNGFSTNLAAASQSKGGGRGVDVGYAMFTEEQFKGGAAAGLSLFYSFSDSFRVELRGGFISNQVENAPEGLSKGKLTMIPIQLSLHYRFKAGNKFRPYVGGGVGYYLNNFSLEGESEWQELGFDITNEVDHAFGYHLGIGMDYFFNSRTAFNLDVRYCIVSLSGSYSITDQVSSITNSGDIEGALDHINFAAGLKFLF